MQETRDLIIEFLHPDTTEMVMNYLRRPTYQVDLRGREEYVVAVTCFNNKLFFLARPVTITCTDKGVSQTHHPDTVFVVDLTIGKYGRFLREWECKTDIFRSWRESGLSEECYNHYKTQCSDIGVIGDDIITTGRATGADSLSWAETRDSFGKLTKDWGPHWCGFCYHRRHIYYLGWWGHGWYDEEESYKFRWKYHVYRASVDAKQPDPWGSRILDHVDLEQPNRILIQGDGDIIAVIDDNKKKPRLTLWRMCFFMTLMF